ncbi:DUF6444 domain-containing protein [Ectothiorhodospira haloalkaliphila]|uniref:DUF6444 domain-containing protein n=1 Tax=Ectothiorhodospira haloalkaliphila TaxID=421628 RepID=UPI003B75CDF8
MRLQRSTQAELDGMRHARRDALIMQLLDALGTLSARLAVLEKKVEKNSLSSSKSPSSADLRKGWRSHARRGNGPVAMVKRAARA